MNCIHRYRRINLARMGNKPYWVMRCIKPRCNSYTPMATKLSAPALLDKLAECSRCGEQFILNKRALRMTNPCCDDCVNTKKTPELKQAEDFWTKLEEEAKK